MVSNWPGKEARRGAEGSALGSGEDVVVDPGPLTGTDGYCWPPSTRPHQGRALYTQATGGARDGVDEHLCGVAVELEVQGALTVRHHAGC